MRRTEDDPSAPDGLLPLFFAPVFGRDTQQLQTSATAYVEARDIVAVLDYSASMNDDSCYASLNLRDRSQLDANMLDIWARLDAVRDFGTLPGEPAWARQSVTSQGQSGSLEFRNTQVAVSSLNRAHESDRAEVQRRHGTQTTTASGTSGTFQKTSGSLKTIVEATVRVLIRGTGRNRAATAPAVRGRWTSRSIIRATGSSARTRSRRSRSTITAAAHDDDLLLG